MPTSKLNDCARVSLERRHISGCSSVAEQWRSTLKAEVRFLSPAPFLVKERSISRSPRPIGWSREHHHHSPGHPGIGAGDDHRTVGNSICLSPHSGRPSLEVGDAGRWLVAVAS